MDEKRLMNNLRPMIFFLKIMALFPFSLKDSRFVIVKFEKIYGIGLEIVAIVYYTWETTKLFKTAENLVSMTATFELLSFMTLNGISHIYYLTKINKIQLILNHFIKSSKNIFEKNDFKRIFWVVLFEVISLIIFLIVYNVVLYVESPKYFGKTRRNFERIMENRTSLFVSGISILFSHCLFFCYKILKNCNDKLMQLCPVKTDLFNAFANIENRKESPNLLIRIVSQKIDISTLIEEFNDSFEICNQLNFCFGFSMTVTAVTTMLEIIYGCFLILYYNQLLFNYSVWIIYHVLMLWMVLFACETVTHQVIKLINN